MWSQGVLDIPAILFSSLENRVGADGGLENYNSAEFCF